MQLANLQLEPLLIPFTRQLEYHSFGQRTQSIFGVPVVHKSPEQSSILPLARVFISESLISSKTGSMFKFKP
jgi:hypothetical protein